MSAKSQKDDRSLPTRATRGARSSKNNDSVETISITSSESGPTVVSGSDQRGAGVKSRANGSGVVVEPIVRSTGTRGGGTSGSNDRVDANGSGDADDANGTDGENETANVNSNDTRQANRTRNANGTGFQTDVKRCDVETQGSTLFDEFRANKQIKPTDMKEFRLAVTDPEAPIKWLRWIDGWRVYAQLTGLLSTVETASGTVPRYTEQFKVLHMINTAGDNIAELYNSIKDDNNPDTMEGAIKRIIEHITPTLTVHQARSIFRSTKWYEYDSINQFYKKLIDSAKVGCCFTAVELDSEIASQIVAKCPHTQLQYDLRMQRETSLPLILQMCRVFEAWNKETNGKAVVNKVEKDELHDEINAIKPQTKSINDSKCKKCGNPPHRDGRCPAIGHQCKICKRWNHTEPMCFGKDYVPMRNRSSFDRSNSIAKRQRSTSKKKSRSKSTKKKKKKGSKKARTSSRKKGRHRKDSTTSDSRSSSSTSSSSSSSSSSTTSSSSEEVKNRRAYVVNLDDFESYDSYVSAFKQEEVNKSYKHRQIDVNGVKMKFMIDTGTGVTVIDENNFKKIASEPSLFKPDRNLYGYGGSQIPLLGMCEVDLSTESGISAKTMAYISKGNSGCLLDASSAISLKIIEPGWCKNSTNVFNISNISNDMKALFPKVFSGRVGCLNDYQANLKIDKSIKPVIHRFRPLPYHQREPVEMELKRMRSEGIIEAVTEPTDWILPMVVVKKENGSLRICTDGRALKPAILRTKYAPVTIDNVRHKLNGAKFFSKIDLKNGYFQIKLNQKSRKYTTFATHMGLFRYKRLNMGISCSSEIFQHEITRILLGITNQINISDDILIYADDEQTHDRILREVLMRLQKYGLTVNSEKCIFKVRELKFFGMIFSDKGISPDPEKITALTEARVPSSVEELKSFLGLASYVSNHIVDFASLSKPLWDLANVSGDFKWTEIHSESFSKLKQALSTKATSYYNPNWITTLVVDASSYGLGAVLLQQNPKNHKERVLVECASRLLSKTEQRYSQIEKEALAAVWACERLYMYLDSDYSGFKLVTDNRAVDLIYRNPLSKPPIRIHRWALRMSQFKYVIEHKSGKENCADYLSRTAKELPLEEVSEESDSVNALIDSLITNTVTRLELVEETKNDPVLQAVTKEILTNGTFKSKEVSQFENKKNLLYLSDDGIVLCGGLVVIPKALQQRVINIAHESHQGQTKTVSLLQQSVYFPGLVSQTKEICSRCTPCQLAQSRLVERPILMREIPNEAWEQIACDFYGPCGEDGAHILVITDCYSRFPDAFKVKSVAGKYVIPIIHDVCRRFGYPKLIRSDCGAPFNGHEWEEFAKTYNIEHSLCTPHHHEANGLVESFMKNLTKQRRVAHVTGRDYFEQIKDFLAHYRATPHTTTGKTPSSLLFRYYAHHSRLPRPQCITQKEKHVLEAEEQDKDRKEKYKLNKERIGFFGYKNFKEGDLVRLRIMESQAKHKPVLSTEKFKVVNIHRHKVFVKREDGTGKILQRDEADVEFVLNSGKNSSDSDCEIIETERDPSKRLTLRNGVGIRLYRGGVHGLKGRGRGARDA